MRKNALGRTGLQISEIALGAGVTGGILIEADQATQAAALRRAVAGGINWIDTAALYGNGASEANIGQHLAALSPRPQVSTKVRIESDQMSDIAGAIERSLEQSLKRLRVDRVALFQLHNQLGMAAGGRPTLTPQQVLGRGGVADTLDRLKQQGLFQASGITAVGDPEACLDVIETGRFDAAQIYYNAINPSAAWERAPAGWKAQNFAGVMTACRRQNMGVLNIRVWAGGPLATAKRPDRLAVLTGGTDLENELRCAAAVRTALGDAYGTPAQAALRFVLGNSDIATRVIGISELPFLDEALAAVPMGPLPQEAMSKLERLWRNDFRTN
jgi:L-galactose dehydrogenase/L-glyceraldehyde 3-phosphate reductase